MRILWRRWFLCHDSHPLRVLGGSLKILWDSLESLDTRMMARSFSSDADAADVANVADFASVSDATSLKSTTRHPSSIPPPPSTTPPVPVPVPMPVPVPVPVPVPSDISRYWGDFYENS